MVVGKVDDSGFLLFFKCPEAPEHEQCQSRPAELHSFFRNEAEARQASFVRGQARFVPGRLPHLLENVFNRLGQRRPVFA
jgi:hypothetical protein